MKRRPSRALVWIVATIAAGGCRHRGHPDPTIRMAVSHDRESASGGKELSESVPTKLVVPPEVTAAYSGIRIGWKDSQSGQEGVLEVPIGGVAPLPTTELVIRADVFLPSFSMNAEEITSTGIGEENPAARIAVVQGSNEIFAGWIFKRFPDVHPFQHPRFSLKLEGGVSRKQA
ncbi:MAG TPA: hypothetical protein VF999_09485 [Thermoanaerobaculia bacterium]